MATLAGMIRSRTVILSAISLAVVLSTGGSGAHGGGGARTHLLGPTHEQPQRTSQDRFDRAVRLISRCTVPQRNGDHLRLLRGLRQLRDPELKPLFDTLAQFENVPIRLHGVLALAEIDPGGRVDPWKLSQLHPLRVRAAALRTTLDLDLIGVEELRQILTWTDLEQAMEAAVFIVLTAWGEPVEIEAVQTLLTEGASPDVRAAAALILLNLGQPQGTAEVFAEINEMPPRLQKAAIAIMAQTLRIHPLPGAWTWVRDQLDRRDHLDRTLAFELIYTLMQLNIQEGISYWNDAYASADDDLVTKLRLALVLLDRSRDLTPDVFDGLRSESEEILRAQGEAGAAAAAGLPARDEAAALIRFHHRLSSLWVYEHANRIKGDDGAAILQALIQDTLDDGPAMSDRLELARLASSDLLELDPGRLRAVLESAHRLQRRLTEEAILAGALRRLNPTAMSLIDEIQDWSSTKAGSLALLIRARYSPTLSPDDIYRLELVFRGAGSVSEFFQIQAAWMYLKHTSQHMAALTAVLGELSPAGTTKP